MFGFSKLDVMFGRRTADSVLHRYADIVKPGVRFVPTVIRSIDPEARRVETDAGSFEGDVMVVALGADLEPAATPGLVEAGHEFYTVAGAFACRDVLDAFEGGRVVIGVTSTPFKCPPAPSETALLVHDFLAERGLREALRDRPRDAAAARRSRPRPMPPRRSSRRSRSAASSGIPGHLVRELTPARPASTTAPRCRSTSSSVCPSTSCPTSSPTRACASTAGSPSTRHAGHAVPGVYAVGDVASVGTPKAGVFAEGQAAVVADEIIATVRGGSAAGYEGRGVCYLEFGSEGVAVVDVTFVAGQAAVRLPRRPVRRAHRRQDGVRHDPGQALVRQRLRCTTSPMHGRKRIDSSEVTVTARCVRAWRRANPRPVGAGRSRGTLARQRHTTTDCAEPVAVGLRSVMAWRPRARFE